MQPRLASAVSFVGLCIAGFASMATSAPPPDWTLRDDVNGEIELPADQDEATFRVRVSSAVVESSIGVTFNLDPKPVLGKTNETTPIVLFAGFDNKASDPIPRSSYGDGTAINLPIDANTKDRIVVVRLSRAGSELTGTNLSRPRAERARQVVKWAATVSVSGYDDQPAGASVTIEKEAQ